VTNTGQAQVNQQTMEFMNKTNFLKIQKSVSFVHLLDSIMEEVKTYCIAGIFIHSLAQ
jgi:hypothetical protein